MTQAPKPGPEIKWDGKTWHVTLPVEHGQVLEAKWEPGHTYIVRIREVASGPWSFGFQTPIPTCTFVDLKPDTEYEVQVRAKTAAGEGRTRLSQDAHRPRRSGHQRRSLSQTLTREGQSRCPNTRARTTHCSPFSYGPWSSPA